MQCVPFLLHGMMSGTIQRRPTSVIQGQESRVFYKNKLQLVGPNTDEHIWDCFGQANDLICRNVGRENRKMQRMEENDNRSREMEISCWNGQTKISNVAPTPQGIKGKKKTIKLLTSLSEFNFEHISLEKLVKSWYAYRMFIVRLQASLILVK